MSYKHRRAACKPNSAATSQVTSATTEATPVPQATKAIRTLSDNQEDTKTFTPAAKATPSSSNKARLFPAGNVAGSSSSAWSTSSSVDSFLPMSDSTFNPQKLMKSLPHDYVTAPDGVQSLEVVYPKGTAALSNKDTPAGGVSFYSPGPSDFDLSNAKEVTLAYSVLFEEGFEFNNGGKLPGIYGGDNPETAISCSGGRQDARNECFSTRYMWRPNGQGESYTYLPKFAANKAQCSQVPGSSCNDDFGDSVGRGLIQFTPGKRTTISQRVRLNDAGQSNGELEVFQDGKSVFTLTGIVLRQGSQGRIFGIQMQSFFGGHGPDWVSPKFQKAYFGEFSMAVTQTL